jgi:hypothetical protein
VSDALALTDADLRWSLDGSSPWLASQPVVDLALDALPSISDPAHAALVIELLETIADLRERGRAFEQLVTIGLSAWHHRAAADARRRRLRSRRG